MTEVNRKKGLKNICNSVTGNVLIFEIKNSFKWFDVLQIQSTELYIKKLYNYFVSSKLLHIFVVIDSRWF